ncbi:MAG: stage II sporulation protein P [Clostridia bacterium]|nr:stage II sporulation protein P [Clostridia bacterium]
MMRRLLAAALCLLALLSGQLARAENDGDCVFTLLDADGQALTQRAGRMYVGDEYIAPDDRCYRIVSVDDAKLTAVAESTGSPEDEISPNLLAAAVGTATAEPTGVSGKKLICMYSTHSDESYVPDDGTESKWKNAGIYDVGESLKQALEALGIDAVYSRETFLPHDADAYTRSRRTAEELLKKGPDALIDVHRDAVPANQYETKVDGDDVSKVRLFVGRSNPNAAANKAFARQLKAAADEAYPGLVKDIFIGRGNYNQELYPHAILLEFGTHEIDKDKAIASTKYMANVLNAVLYGGAASGTGRGAGLKSAMKGAGWAVLALAVAAAAYALLATGSGRAAAHKLRRNFSELTGGLFGDRHPRD